MEKNKKEKKPVKPIAMPGVYSGTEFLEMLEKRIEAGDTGEVMSDRAKEIISKLSAMGNFVALGKDKEDV